VKQIETVLNFRFPVQATAADYDYEFTSGGSRSFCLGANGAGIFVWGLKMD